MCGRLLWEGSEGASRMLPREWSFPFYSQLTCAKARPHMAIRMPVDEANIETGGGATAAFMPGCERH